MQSAGSTDPNYAPSEHPAAGPEKGTRAGGRPVSGKTPSAGPGAGQDADKVWQVNRTTPVLKNTVTDPDKDTATLTFEVWTTNADGTPKAKLKLTGKNDDPDDGVVSDAHGVIVSKYVASGSTAEVTIPYGNLKTNTTYAFRTSAYDGSLYETDWSPWAKFHTRGRQLSITLPEPDNNAPAVDLDKYQTEVTASRKLPPPPPVRSADGGADGLKCSDRDGKGNKVCMGTVSDAEVPKAAEKRLRAEADLVPWCAGKSAGDAYFTRTEACIKDRGVTVLRFVYYDANDQELGVAWIAQALQIKLDTKSKTIKHELTMVPTKYVESEPGALGNISFQMVDSCEAEGAPGRCKNDEEVWSPEIGSGNVWTPAAGDYHSAKVSMTTTWTPGTETAQNYIDLDWELWGHTSKSTKIGKSSLGSTEGDLSIRCDAVSSTTPGCVFPAYKPTWVMNFKKAPAAVAHAWLIQTKLPNHPGSKSAGKPMQYLPESGTAGWVPQDSRDVICPKNPDKSSWAGKYGNPDTTTLPEFTTSNKDPKSCDEFAYASTYNSAGMPDRFGGLNPVASGDECLQTYATRYKAGVWKLYDDTRHAAPTYKELCGRSSMSSWMNSASMAGFSSGFSSKQRLLDKDEYWVAFPEFAHCGTADKLTCTVPKP
ncbi:hypothetical protein [Streptomyces qinglanensis]|uniref:hypothetical protein n=1 Tax=Streptomyces qinglanensis TaxID=943816 RepID=UPI0037BB4A83